MMRIRRACEAWTLVLCIVAAIVVVAVSACSGCQTARSIAGVIESVGADLAAGIEGVSAADHREGGAE